jgi:hypothetical protein
MEQILYLGHETMLENLENILNDGYLYTSYERKKLNIKYEGVMSLTNAKDFSNKEIPIKHFKDEFPGVYFNYYTKSTITRQYVPQILLVFGCEMLKQNNYHVNLYDHNGKIMEYITFSKENIDSLPDIKDVLEFYDENKINSYYNEIIFHDKINIKLLTKIWCNNKDTYDKIHNLISNNSNIKNKKIFLDMLELHYKLPNRKMHIPKHMLSYLDMKSLPYYVFYFDNTYTGIKIPYYPYKTKFFSSLTFCKNIARIANVSDDVLKNIHDIPNLVKYMEKNKLFDYYFHNRDKQNTEILNSILL